VLDVGCGSKPYAKLFSNATSYEGLDIDQPRNRERAIADHFYAGGDFPFPDESFDNVVCSQVLEHVFDPDRFCAELARILIPGGKLLLTVPFIWDEHEQPWDSRRYTSFGLRDLMEKSGFKVLVQEKLLIGYPAIVQLIQARLQKGRLGMLQQLPGKFPRLLEFSNAPLNLLGELIQALPTSDSDLYLDNFLLLERKHSNA
jgi:SAM-dependent methyltransferase